MSSNSKLPMRTNLTLMERFVVRWRMKAVANTLGLGSFFPAYFWVQNHAPFEVTHMPLLAIDYWIPYLPAAIVPYATLWLYVSLPLAFLTRSEEFRAFGLGAAVLSIVGLGCFYFWPTAVPFVAGWSADSSSSLLRHVDGAGNACPSLHVAYAVFTWAWLRRLLADIGARPWVRFANATWCVAIVLSTLAIRQHVVIDVLAGAALGGAVAALNMAWLRSAFMPSGLPGTSPGSAPHSSAARRGAG